MPAQASAELSSGRSPDSSTSRSTSFAHARSRRGRRGRGSGSRPRPIPPRDRRPRACRAPWRARRRGSSCPPTPSARRRGPGGRRRGARRATVSRVFVVAVGDRQHDHLVGGEPEREAAAVVLDQDPREALHRAEQGAVDHHRPVLGVVRARVGELEALRHEVVDLAGAALPGAPERVGDVEIDLRPVEGAVARVDLVWPGRSSRARRRAPRQPPPTPRRRRSTSPGGSRARRGRRRTRRSRRARRSPRRCRSPRRRICSIVQ